jgi:glyoxylase-like metal-dependent hydrolase (beta-lactamase superfamily II)
MARLPLEDNFTDVIAKAQRGLGLSDADLAARAEVSAADLAAVQGGRVIDAVLRRVARHLGLSPWALEDLAHDRWYPATPDLRRGFAMFCTRHEGMGVNNYLVWDPASREAAVFDTGADAAELLDVVRAERLRVSHLFLTHTHEDHIAARAALEAATRAPLWVNEREAADAPGARTFADNAYFHVGALAIKALLTSGHSPGGTTYFITGLLRPLAIVGDALFASSMGGSPTHFAEQRQNDLEKILKLPRDTVLACGHGPLTTVEDEKQHNPFFVR